MDSTTTSLWTSFACDHPRIGSAETRILFAVLMSEFAFDFRSLSKRPLRNCRMPEVASNRSADLSVEGEQNRSLMPTICMPLLKFDNSGAEDHTADDNETIDTDFDHFGILLIAKLLLLSGSAHGAKIY